MRSSSCFVGVIALCLTSTALAAPPPDPKYAAIDAARATLIAALESGDATAFAGLLDAQAVEVADVWFDTKPCRKQWKSKSLDAKTAPAFVTCMQGLGVRATGLNVHYGPGVQLVVRFDYVEGQAVLRRLSGSPNVVAPSAPMVSGKELESHRTEGTPITLDQAARDELAAADDSGVVVHVCVNPKGVATAKRLMPKVAAKGPTAKAVKAALATWKLTPFTVRGKPATACAMIVAK